METKTQDIIKSKINTVFIHVTDLKRAVDWYADTLGFSVDQEEYKALNDLPVYTFQMGETSLSLDAHKFDDSFVFKPAPHPVCNIHCEDIYKAHEMLKDKKVEILSDVIDLGDLAFFNIKDMDGNVLMMCNG
ncbi:VOC family protein [Fictibacillus enclensis]|uniref:VOC family protein n=1 Tax=Fictibacillus enclensis TaxID=1017270 RepID=UPI0025A1F32F|nr:VOC family protein [Fictibacillus enclensis]MDM5335818.1 VOC family protein [Fictibacillus enclensis]